MKSRYIIMLAMACLLSLTVSAQKAAPITFDAENLSTQMLEFLNRGTSDDSKKKENAKLVKNIESYYSKLDSRAQGRVVDMMDLSQKKKLRPMPEVHSLLCAMLAYMPDARNYPAWMDCVSYMLQNKSAKSLLEFVDFSVQFLSDRTLNKTKSNLWQAQSGCEFELQFDGKDVLIRFPKPIELYYSSGQDNGTIYSTTGTYSYSDNIWRGQGGRINWDRTGLPTTACWAILSSYEAGTKLPKFTADSVMFTNTKYFERPILGRLEESLSGKAAPEKYTYPKFRSYQTDFELKDILPGVDYKGSFMMNGSKFVTANEKYPATLIFSRGGRPFVVLTSTNVTVANNKINAEHAAMRMYLDEDSIFNNGVKVRYTGGDRKLTFVNDAKRNYYSPYGNTFHNLDMFCESMTWDMDRDRVTFASIGADGSNGNATFESANYYSAIKYRSIQGIDEVSPVMRMYRFMRDNNGGVPTFYVDVFAQYIRMDVMQAKSMVHNLAKDGLVSYDENAGLVYVQEKLTDYVKAYNKDKNHDYDAISLYSSKVKQNAVLDLASNDLQLYGVDSLFVSDSQQVIIYPSKREILMKRNRDMYFDGAVHCGRFDFAVRNAVFHYADFMFDLPTIDKMVFSVQQFGNPQKLHGVNSVLRNLKGTLTIDKPTNHNGLVKNKEYPIFTSQEECFVYYDNKDLYHGAYVRDRFYYRINPFTLNSLKDFKTDSLQFEGTLVSAGIFPDLNQPLTVQRDYSLGFDMDTEKSGLQAYGGKGSFTRHLNLSNKGLRGAGKVDYLTSFSTSKEIVFLPDSMLATTDTFLVRKEQGFPDIRNGRTAQSWYPYADSMQVNQLKGGHQFQMYGGEAQLAGGVTLRPQGALAQGTATIMEGTLSSQRFELQTMDMLAKVSSFQLQSTVYRQLAYSATNMSSHVDFTGRRTELTSNADIQRTELPLVAYNAYIDKVSWEMDRKELDLLNSKSEDSQGLEGLSLRERNARPQPGARFVCTANKADSLQYFSTRSTYRYNAGQLTSRGVFVLNVADAAIAPAADTLHIGVGGEMRQLRHAQLLASRSNGYHLFYDGDFIVKNLRTYSGKAYIDYVDEEDRAQKIFCDDIAPSQAGITVANGFISDSASFTLNSAFGFAGKVRVEGNQQFFHFDGGVRLLHKCAEQSQLALLAYSSYLDPKNIMVAVPEIPVDWRGNRIAAAILMDQNTLAPKPAFLMKEKVADNEVLSAYGLLTYDKGTRVYTIARLQKQENFDGVVDPYLRMNTETCQVEGEGPASLCYREGLTSKYAYAKAVATSRPADFELSGVFGFTFPIAANVVEAIAQQIADDLRLSPGSPDNELLRHAMISAQGVEKGNENYSTYVSTGAFDRIPAAFEHTLLFENLTWHYNPGVGYYTSGMTTLALMGKKQLHLNLRVMANLNKAGAGQVLNLYVQAARDHWYYFSYNTTSHTLTLCSSVGAIEDMVKSISVEDRQQKTKEGLTFQYKVGSQSEVVRFQTKMSAALTGTEGIDAPDVSDDEED